MAAENITGTVYDIKMVVFKMDILFATNKTWADSLDDESPEERQLGSKVGKEKCGHSGNGASGKKENDDKVDWCKKKGCGRRKCPNNNSRRVNDSGSNLDNYLGALHVRNH